MSILTNITSSNSAANSKFMKVFDTNKDYALKLENAFATTTDDKGGRDHFISMSNDIDRIKNMYAPVPMKSILEPDLTNINAVINNIQNNENLRKWVISVFCTFIYAFDNTNKLDVFPIPFNIVNGDVVNKVPNSEFIEVWHQKFNKNTENDNHYSGFDFNTNNNSLNILAFSADGYSDMIGCYSNDYLVIPLKEMALQGENVKPWKKTYNKLMSRGKDFINTINDTLSLHQLILLKCSAMSIAQVPNISKSLQLIAAIIGSRVKTEGINLDDVNINPMKKIGDVELFQIIDVINTDDLISNTLNILCTNDGNCYSTYPFTEIMIDALTNQVGTLSNISLAVDSVTDTSGKRITGATICARYTSKFVFNAPVAGNQKQITYFKDITKKYSPENIKNIIAMPTLCMYPNLSVDYEDQCCKYTYLSCEGALIMGEPLVNINNVSLQNGTFKASITAGAGKSIIFNGNGSESKIVDFGNKPKLKTQSASVLEHFIGLSDELGNKDFGYIINLRNSNAQEDTPALLCSNGAKINISFAKTAPAPNGTFKAYVDFGSSSNYMAYAINNGALLQDIIKDNCTMRMLLIDYNDESKKTYKSFINDPRETNLSKFPSSSIIYNPYDGIRNMYIYKDAWMPITKTSSEFAMLGIKVQPSMKTTLINGATEASPNIIINNLCYIIACNAVVNNCNIVNILPSLPSEDYLRNISNLWNSAILNIKAIFPNLTINNLLVLKQKEFLYESVAISNGTVGAGVNVLQINIDIGDGTTDMSAMITNGAGKMDMCGYSSIGYAGKNLIKTVLKDILNSTDKKTAIHLFKGMYAKNDNPTDDIAMNFGNPLLVPKNNMVKDYCGRVNNLINNFFNSDEKESRKKKPEISWENNIIDILDISDMSRDIDMKVASNLILRYMLLMPVIKDFILTAIKIAGSNVIKGTTTINIDFYGGAAKGIDLLSVIDPRKTNARDMLTNYFINELKNYAVNVNVPQIDSKYSLVKGLANIPVVSDGKGGFTIGAGAANIAQINWDNVNPKNSSIFGETDNIHKDAEKFNFASLADCKGSPAIAQATNDAKIYNHTSYYDNPNDPFDELSAYFYDEIFNKLIDNSDGVSDCIEIIIGDFIKEASNNMKSDARKELITGASNNSFYRATHSNIYPEMIKNSIFMFTISELLSKYHNGYQTTGKIDNFNSAGTYKFGS